MNRRTLNILRGIGSVLEIYQDVDYSKYMPEVKHIPQRRDTFQVAAENLYNDWVKVGDALRHAMGIVDVEQDKKANK